MTLKERKALIQYENTIPGIFLRRNNRFAAEVLVEGKPETVHVKNTGRLRELLVSEARITLQKADQEGYHCQIAFVIQMNGIHHVIPNDETQPEFGQALIRAARAGVQIAHYSCHVEADSIEMIGMTDDPVTFNRNLMRCIE